MSKHKDATNIIPFMPCVRKTPEANVKLNNNEPITLGNNDDAISLIRQSLCHLMKHVASVSDVEEFEIQFKVTIRFKVDHIDDLLVETIDQVFIFLINLIKYAESTTMH